MAEYTAAMYACYFRDDNEITCFGAFVDSVEDAGAQSFWLIPGTEEDMTEEVAGTLRPV